MTSNVFKNSGHMKHKYTSINTWDMQALTANLLYHWIPGKRYRKSISLKFVLNFFQYLYDILFTLKIREKPTQKKKLFKSYDFIPKCIEKWYADENL